MKEYKKGQKRAWRGYTLRENPNGYLRVYAPNHPMADKIGRVSIHRLVMSEKLGRPLLPSEIVHHLDGDIQNNDPSNLSLCKSVSMHMAFHSGYPNRQSRLHKKARYVPRVIPAEDHEYYLAIINTLRDARFDAGMTQQELSKRLGKRDSWISGKENGVSALRKSDIISICTVLGIGCEPILSGNDANIFVDYFSSLGKCEFAMG